MRDRVKTSCAQLSRFCTFSVLALLMVYGITCVMVPVDSDSQSIRGFYSEEENSLDMVYVGASICVMSWQPYEAWQGYGIASFAYGSSGIRSYDNLPLVREALSRQAPRLLVIDLSPFQYTMDEMEKSASILVERGMVQWSPNRLAAIDNIMEYSSDLGAQDTKTSFIFDIIRSHGTWRDLSRSSFAMAFPGLMPSATKGYRIVTARHTPLDIASNAQVSECEPVSSRAEADLRALLEYAHEQGVATLFVVTPYAETEQERRQYNYLAAIIDEYGSDYVNFNDYIDEIGIDPQRDYYDERHMNVFGAEKYTAFLASYVCSHWEMPDRREDAGYADWDNGYERWLPILQSAEDATRELIDTEPDSG